MIKQIYSVALLPLSLLVIFLAGCTKTVTNIKLPPSDPKLVVGCFISPQDTLITVTLTRSRPVFGPNQSNSTNEAVSDASVVLSNDTNSISIPFHNTDMRYQLSANAFPIAAGQTYFLTVSTPKGENVSASCTVPSSAIASITVDCIDTAAASSQKKINVKWNDIPNETNYYRVTAAMIQTDTAGYDSYYSMYVEYPLKNDVGKDGKEFISKMTGDSSANTTRFKISYHIYVMNINTEYYKYQYSLDNDTHQNPFAEPNQLYTNIKGGLGIFAAYQKIYKIIP